MWFWCFCEERGQLLLFLCCLESRGWILAASLLSMCWPLSPRYGCAGVASARSRDSRDVTIARLQVFQQWWWPGPACEAHPQSSCDHHPVAWEQAWGRQLQGFSASLLGCPPDDGALPLCQALAAAAAASLATMPPLQAVPMQPTPGLSLGLSPEPELPHPVPTCAGRQTSQPEEPRVVVLAF